ncbi:MAG: serine protease [Oscillospiraceae bacterium]|jgi:membrane-bound ClpP family serine protease|nr:serine protease [Oscillospiraceae bacterium]
MQLTLALASFGVLDGLTTLTIVLLIVGLVLIVVEFFIPGFGIAGGLGIVCWIAAIILTAKTMRDALILGGCLALIAAALVWLFVLLGAHGKLPKKLVLSDSTDKAEGFSSAVDYSGLLGKRGAATTALRPAGKARIDGEIYDVVSPGEFLAKDTVVEVAEVEGIRIVVRKTS